MEESIGGLLPQKQQEWEEDLKKIGMNVDSAEVISREMERYMPSYLFLVLDQEPAHGHGGLQPNGKVAFFTRDDRPFTIDEDGKVRWYPILPDNLPYVRLKVKELVPTAEVRDGVEGYVVPLQESPSYNELKAVVAYQRNLMFWESMLCDDGYGPLAGRLAFLAHAVCRLKGEQREAVVVLDGSEAAGAGWYGTRWAVESGTKKQGKKKKRAKVRVSYQVPEESKVEQVRMGIMREKIKEWLNVSEQDRKEEELLYARVKLRLEELQRICSASQALSKERDDLLKVVSKDVIGKGWR